MKDESPTNNELFAEEGSLTDIMKALWDGRNFIASLSFLFLLGSLIVVILMPNIYESKVVLAPRSDTGSGGLSGLASQYGGLASLAGLNLSSLDDGKIPKTLLARKQMESLVFFSEYLYPSVLPDLMAVDVWDSGSAQLLYDSDIYDSKTKTWKREGWFFFKRPKPSEQEAHEEFLDLFTVSEDKSTGLVTVRVRHQSPVIAKAWIDLIISSVMENIRSKDVTEAEESIAFLTKKRQSLELVAIDAVFAQLIEDQTKTIMLANASKYYIFDIIEPPVVAEKKVYPQRFLVCGLSLLFGFFLAVSGVLLKDRIRQTRMVS